MAGVACGDSDHHHPATQSICQTSPAGCPCSWPQEAAVQHAGSQTGWSGVLLSSHTCQGPQSETPQAHHPSTKEPQVRHRSVTSPWHAPTVMSATSFTAVPPECNEGESRLPAHLSCPALSLALLTPRHCAKQQLGS